VARIVWATTGDEVAEGTIGHVQATRVYGCTPLVTVAWDGRGGEGQPPAITDPVSVENLEPVDRPRKVDLRPS
jgi:hypothetical protein